MRTVEQAWALEAGEMGPGSPAAGKAWRTGVWVCGWVVSAAHSAGRAAHRQAPGGPHPVSLLTPCGCMCPCVHRALAREGIQCSQLRPEAAMAKTWGRLYLWVCAAVVLVSFLAGFLVGKCAPGLGVGGVAAQWGQLRFDPQVAVASPLL